VRWEEKRGFVPLVSCNHLCLAIFIFAGDEISSSTFTAELLAKLLPHLGRAEIREYVVLVRKAGHFLAYGLLTLLVYRAAAKTKGMQRYALPGAAFLL